LKDGGEKKKIRRNTQNGRTWLECTRAEIAYRKEKKRFLEEKKKCLEALREEALDRKEKGTWPSPEDRGRRGKDAPNSPKNLGKGEEPPSGPGKKKKKSYPGGNPQQSQVLPEETVMAGRPRPGKTCLQKKDSLPSRKREGALGGAPGRARL